MSGGREPMSLVSTSIPQRGELMPSIPMAEKLRQPARDNHQCRGPLSSGNINGGIELNGTGPQGSTFEVLLHQATEQARKASAGTDSSIAPLSLSS